MIWFFDRDGEKLRYEISHDRSAGRYRVVITRPDGTESVEEVDEPTALIRIETRAGHGAGKPIEKQVAEQSDIYSFLFHNLTRTSESEQTRR